MPVTTFQHLGSMSTATMRPEDLIPAFLDALRYIAPNDPDVRDTVAEVEERMEAEDYYDSEESDWDLNETLFDALDALAPPYVHFGAHEGDGADYGFWVSWESLEEDERAGEVLRLDAGDDWPDPLPDGTAYVLAVTDHGNATLYDALDPATPLWECV